MTERWTRKGADAAPQRGPKPLKWRWVDAVQAKDSGLSSTDRAVAIAHGLHADDDGYNVFPGATLVATKTAFSVKTVEKSRRRLELGGWLFVIERGGFDEVTRRKRVTEYRLSLPAVDNSARPPAQHPSPPAHGGRLEIDHPPTAPRPPAVRTTTTRPGEDVLTKDSPENEPAGQPSEPPAVGGGLKLPADAVAEGLAAIAEIRSSRQAS